MFTLTSQPRGRQAYFRENRGTGVIQELYEPRFEPSRQTVVCGLYKDLFLIYLHSISVHISADLEVELALYGTETCKRQQNSTSLKTSNCIQATDQELFGEYHI